MPAENLMLDAVDRRIEFYEEKWLAEHRIAQLCCDFEERLFGFIELFRLICDLNEAWREDVFSGEIRPRSDLNPKIKSLFERWMACDPNIQKGLTFFERQGYAEGVKGADHYRDCLREAQEILAAWQEPELSVAIGPHAVTLNREQSNALRQLLAH